MALKNENILPVNSTAQLLKKIVAGVLLLYATNISAARLEGFEPDYAGRTIQFVTRIDPVSKTDVAAFALTIGPQGRIQIETGATDTLFCYADFDSYRGWMLLIPGTTTRISLPPLKVRSFEERKNPYFQPIELWIHAESSAPDNLTAAFARSERSFYQLSDSFFNQLFVLQQKQFIDTIRIKLSGEHAKNNHPLVSQHHDLLLANLEADLTRSGREKLMAPFSSLSATARNSPAFADLLDRIFSNTLSLESKTSRGDRIKTMVERRNLAGIRAWSEGYSGTHGVLADMVTIKLLHDAFYSGEFGKNTVLQMLQQPDLIQHPNLQVRSSASAVVQKLQFLHTGTLAPKICLPDLAGNPVCSTAPGKAFQYILFVDLDIPVGREQLKYLAEIYPSVSERLDLFVVLTQGERTDNRTFVEEHKIPGTIVIDHEHQSIGKQYKIRSFPSALLLDRQHRVVLSSARTPLDGFMQQFAGLTR